MRVTNAMWIVVAATAVTATLVWFVISEMNSGNLDIESTSCNVEAFGNSPFEHLVPAHDGDQVTISGWAADVEGKRIAKDVTLFLVNVDGKRFQIGVGKPSIDRDDVVAAFKTAAVRRSGFSIPSTVTVPRSGDYEIAVVGRFDPTDLICHPRKIVRVAK